MSNTVNFMLEDISCPIGCDKSDAIILTGTDLIQGLPGIFTVVKCRTCGLMRTNPRPTAETIGDFYPADYGPYLGTKVQQSATNRSHGFIRLINIFKSYVLRTNTQLMPALAPGRFLEVGCASGAFLRQMAGQGWQVEGIEFSEKAAQTAAQLGYHVHAGSLETAPQPLEPFDLIAGWMVLEHLHDPIHGLRKLRDWAKPDAYLVLSVPNAASLSFRFFKSNWYDLHLPNHLFHFTPQSLAIVLEAGGWKLEKVHHQRMLNNLIASTGYAMRDKGYTQLGQKFIDYPARAGRWAYILFPLAWLLSLLGQTGRMTVWARINR
jgi:2-polyprenyl-3-methyl-5-hydroxy-6-metoxy-1,4-benzoquinol methylase